VLRGISRVMLDELPFISPYRRAQATLLRDPKTVLPQSERTALLGAASSFAAAVRKHDSSFSFELPSDLDDAALADACAHHLIVDPLVRQAVLEQLDIAKRVRNVTSELVIQRRALFGNAGGALN
ncbi:MAG: LON peptidase substrate-binding domain-containing protein, partial [Polyangiaceae bacterium]